MINILLVMYFGGLFFFSLAAFAIIYHLQAFHLNHKIATFSTLVFIVGSILILAFNIVSAIQVDWDSLPIIIIS